MPGGFTFGTQCGVGGGGGGVIYNIYIYIFFRPRLLCFFRDRARRGLDVIYCVWPQV